MWFLQVDTLLLLLGLALIHGLLLHLPAAPRAFLGRVLPVVDIAFLWYISWSLAAFYIGYVLVTWALTVILRKITTGRKFFFFAFCFACLIPLCWARTAPFLSLPGAGFIGIGIAYNMLKAIDTLYYEYFTGEKADFLTYVNYMLFLPVLTAGPVFRYRDFKKTWSAPAALTIPRLTTGTKRIVSGLFMKVVLSALCLSLLDFLMARLPAWYLAPVIPFVSLAVLFFDMAGYASIAIGTGYIMGYTVPENFKKPFSCPSFTQFWRNWHVTVSDWIREHVFILFNGVKLTKWHGAAISMAVMIIMGLWHGFTMVFFVDGILLGLFLAVEALFGLGTVNKRKVSRPYYILRCFIVTALFAANSMIFTLSTAEISLVAKSALSILGGVL